MKNYNYFEKRIDIFSYTKKTKEFFSTKKL